MNKTEKQIRLCMRIMHRLIRRWYEEQGITRENCPYICSLTLHTSDNQYYDWYEDENVR